MAKKQYKVEFTIDLKNQKFKEGIEASKKDIKALSDQIKALSDKAKDFNEITKYISGLNKASKDSVKNINNTTNSVKKLRDELSKLNTVFKSKLITDKLTQVNLSIKEALNNINKLQSAFGKLKFNKNFNKNIDEGLSKLESSLNNAVGNIIKLREALDKTSGKARTIQIKVALNKQTYDEDIKGVLNKYKDLKNKIKQIDAQLSKATGISTHLAAFDRSINSIISHINKINTALSKVQEQFQSFLSAGRSLEVAFNPVGAVSKLKDIYLWTTENKNEVLALKNEFQSLGGLKNTFSGLVSDLNELNKRISTIKGNLNTVNTAFGNLGKKLAIDGINSKLRSVASASSNVSNQVNKITANLERLENIRSFTGKVITGFEKIERQVFQTIEMVNLFRTETARIKEIGAAFKPLNESVISLKSLLSTVNTDYGKISTKVTAVKNSFKEMISSLKGLNEPADKSSKKLNNLANVLDKLNNSSLGVIRSTGRLNIILRELYEALLFGEASLVRINPEYKALNNSIRELGTSSKQSSNDLRVLNNILGRTRINNGNLNSARGSLGALGAAAIAATASFQALNTAVNVFNKLLDNLIEVKGFVNTLSIVGMTANQALDEFNKLREYADKIGISFNNVVQQYHKTVLSFNAAGFSFKESEGIFKDIQTIIAGFHLTETQAGRVTVAFEQMAAKGQVMAEELKRQLGNSLPAATGLFAKSLGVTEKQLLQMMKNGEVRMNELQIAIRFIAAISKEAAEKNAEDVIGSLNKVKNAGTDFMQSLALSQEQSIKDVLSFTEQFLVTSKQVVLTTLAFGQTVGETIKEGAKADANAIKTFFQPTIDLLVAGGNRVRDSFNSIVKQSKEAYTAGNTSINNKVSVADTLGVTAFNEQVVNRYHQYIGDMIADTEKFNTTQATAIQGLLDNGNELMEYINRGKEAIQTDNDRAIAANLIQITLEKGSISLEQAISLTDAYTQGILNNNAELGKEIQNLTILNPFYTATAAKVDELTAQYNDGKIQIERYNEELDILSTLLVKAINDTTGFTKIQKEAETAVKKHQKEVDSLISSYGSMTKRMEDVQTDIDKMVKELESGSLTTSENIKLTEALANAYIKQDSILNTTIKSTDKDTEAKKRAAKEIDKVTQENNKLVNGLIEQADKITEIVNLNKTGWGYTNEEETISRIIKTLDGTQAGYDKVTRAINQYYISQSKVDKNAIEIVKSFNTQGASLKKLTEAYIILQNAINEGVNTPELLASYRHMQDDIATSITKGFDEGTKQARNAVNQLSYWTRIQLQQGISNAFDTAFSSIGEKGIAGFGDFATSLIQGGQRQVSLGLSAMLTGGDFVRADGTPVKGVKTTDGLAANLGFGQINNEGKLVSNQGITQNAIAGFQTGGTTTHLLSGLTGTQSPIGDMIGGALGGIGSTVGTMMGGPLGSMVGSFAGGILGMIMGLFFNKVPPNKATAGAINFNTGEGLGYFNSHGMSFAQDDDSQQMFDAMTKNLQDLLSFARNNRITTNGGLSFEVGERDKIQLSGLSSMADLNNTNTYDNNVQLSYKTVQDATKAAIQGDTQDGKTLVGIIDLMSGVSDEARNIVKSFKGGGDAIVQYTKDVISLDRKTVELSVLFGSTSLQKIVDLEQTYDNIDDFQSAFDDIVQHFGLSDEALKAHVDQTKKTMDESLKNLGMSEDYFRKNIVSMLQSGKYTAETMRLLMNAAQDVAAQDDAVKAAGEDAKDAVIDVEGNMNKLKSVSGNYVTLFGTHSQDVIKQLSNFSGDLDSVNDTLSKIILHMGVDGTASFNMLTSLRQQYNDDLRQLGTTDSQFDRFAADRIADPNTNKDTRKLITDAVKTRDQLEQLASNLFDGLLDGLTSLKDALNLATIATNSYGGQIFAQADQIIKYNNIIKSGQFSAKDLSNLSDAVKSFADTIKTAIQATIDGIKSINQTTQDMLDNLTMDGMTDEQKRQFYLNRSANTEQKILMTDDPNEVSRLTQQAQQDRINAYNLLPDDQRQDNKLATQDDIKRIAQEGIDREKELQSEWQELGKNVSTVISTSMSAASAEFLNKYEEITGDFGMSIKLMAQAATMLMQFAGQGSNTRTNNYTINAPTGLSTNNNIILDGRTALSSRQNLYYRNVAGAIIKA